MHNWEDLRYFLHVARTGSLSAASKSLDVNGSTVSRRIDHLEKSLGYKLFERHRHGVHLTEQGRHFLDPVLQMAHAAESLKGEMDDQVPSLIRLSIPTEFSTDWFVPPLAAFQKQYPSCRITLCSQSDQDADLSLMFCADRQDADALGKLPFSVFASPDYLMTYGFPVTWSDLQGHKLVAYEGYEAFKPLTLWQETLKAIELVFKQMTF